MTTNKVCGKGKCKFTDEFCMSGDCPYDPDVLKNNENFNTLEGYVKMDNINVANNVAQANSQDLTNQYKTGTLLNDFYYFDNGKTQYIVEYHNLKGIEGLEGVEVLERVPSYERWKKLNELLDSSLETNKALAHRLNICKELLKECRDGLEKIKHIGETKKLGAVYQVAERTLARIDEVLK